MPSLNPAEDDISVYSTSVPPPPYPGDQAQYDLTPTPHAINRPRLPEDKRNALLRNLPEDVNIVKFQTIVREGKEIVIGRIKVPTPGSSAHAFILRRYDTNAISLTTMYKCAFPGASEEEEKREMDWVRSSFDTRNTNGGRGSDVVRLAGQCRHLAIHLAPAYGLAHLIASLARAVPDPNVAYRKSQRSQIASEEIARTKTGGSSPVKPAVPSMTAAETASPAPKRQRREPSPQAGASRSTTVQDVEDDARHLTLEATTTVTAPAGAPVDMEAEIQSAKQLVMDLKRELRLRAAAGEELEDQGVDVGEDTRGTKRAKGGDEAVLISGGVGKNRIVRKNKRVVQSPVGEAAKKVAWGALIFGLGVGAATFLPQLASSFL
ncbi:hypothetical protein CI109_100374 [Kwoniella shandongensis]|uniref:HTH APSES-type domain-containing protein n=1 Tax=Kwoniella shandongensis TaxID=1734106 RepID=A0AAJ8MSI3_9TREE